MTNIRQLNKYNNIFDLICECNDMENINIVVENLIYITNLYDSMKELEKIYCEKGECFKIDARVESFFKNDSQKIWNYLIERGYV